MQSLSLVLLLSSLTLIACSEAKPPETSSLGYGQNPSLPAPESSLIPTVNIAPAVGWSNGAKPLAAQGLAVNAFASGLDHPRWLYVLPNGDVLVAETNAPAKPEASGLMAFAQKMVMKQAGAAVPSANRISLLRDSNADGIADLKTVFLSQLNSPFGMQLIGNTLYVANTDAIVSFPYQTGATEISAAPTKLADLPAGSINHHWTKNIIASQDGTKLYATVGSNSNVAENGLQNEINRAAILEVDVKTGASRVFASGLRNPNGLAWEPHTGALWTTVNERDELGNDLVPDYMTSVKEGGFYGWPYSYFGQHIDERVQTPNPELVAQALIPDYALGAHTASLGLAFYQGKALTADYQGGAFVGQHGSWNRKPRSGYKLIFVPFNHGQPSGLPVDILTGFVNEEGKALGRPVGVVVDAKGAVLVADDVGNVIWRVSTAQ